MPIKLKLSRNWLFHPRHSSEHLRRDCDEREFNAVNLPHALRSYPLGGFDVPEKQDIVSYRRHFRLPDTLAGKMIGLVFEGAMSACEVYLNGQRLGEHRGGYTPFRFDLSRHLAPDGHNVLAVVLDPSELPDVPPFGKLIDYIAFGGLFRDVWIEASGPCRVSFPQMTPGGIFAGAPYLRASCRILGSTPADQVAHVTCILRDSKVRVIEEQVVKLGAIPLEGKAVSFQLESAPRLDLWDLSSPHLYSCEFQIRIASQILDSATVRFGMREVRFEADGFYLNQRKTFLRGLNRHQSYPWAGYAMGARAQRRDADILKCDLKCNCVRASHYPQSPDFLDRCDEIGLLVFEEVPGWQHVGGAAWQALLLQSVYEMIERDYNHPCIMAWGIRVNETDGHADLVRAGLEAAHRLDPTRAVGGVPYTFEEPLIEDVATRNDYTPEGLKPPLWPKYLLTEYCGVLVPVKSNDPWERHVHNALKWAELLSQAQSMQGVSGAIGWCAFDYNTHQQFGSGNRICHHGVADLFRVPKFAAGLFRSQTPAEDEIILEPSFYWCSGDHSITWDWSHALVFSNCDWLMVRLEGHFEDTRFPEQDRFSGLQHPPFTLGPKFAKLTPYEFADLTIEGYLGSRLVKSCRLSSHGVDAALRLCADDAVLLADGADATRVIALVIDEYGNRRPQSIGAIQFEMEGPGRLIGDAIQPLLGGVAAVWLRADTLPGRITITAHHLHLAPISVSIELIEDLSDVLAP